MPRSARRRAAAVALVAGALAACEPYVQGNGVYQEERRPDPGSFTGIHVEDGIEATVTAGVASRSVTVSGDASIVPYIVTEVRTDSNLRVLHVSISRAFSPTIPPRAAIEVPVLEHAFATQAARVDAKAVAVPSFEVVADQGSNVVLEGATLPAGASIAVKLGTGALLNASDYGVSSGADVQLSGSSIARLRSDGPVSGTVTGGSQLDNLQGAGGCTAVVVDGSSKLSCR